PLPHPFRKFPTAQELHRIMDPPLLQQFGKVGNGHLLQPPQKDENRPVPPAASGHPADPLSLLHFSDQVLHVASGAAQRLRQFRYGDGHFFFIRISRPQSDIVFHQVHSSPSQKG